MFFFKKKETIPYDPAQKEPAIRRSICTGEMTAGFINRETGVFHDYMLVEGRKGLEDFCESVGVSPESIKTIY